MDIVLWVVAAALFVAFWVVGWASLRQPSPGRTRLTFVVLALIAMLYLGFRNAASDAWVWFMQLGAVASAALLIVGRKRQERR